MDNSLISVIVPIYNVENYLRKCVDSIINQTYKNLEIILVDDGSPDDCGKICDEYAQRYSRVKVIHKVNGGVSEARNVGIEHSTGQYIAFVDPDDITLPALYETLLNEAVRENADIVQCNYSYIFEDGRIEQIARETKTCISENEQNVFSFFEGKIYPVIFGKLFKSSLIENIRFNTNLKISEDRLFVYECCKKATKVKILENVYYYYLQRSNSAIHVFNIKHFDDDIYVTKLFLKEYGKYENVRMRMEIMIVNRCVGAICGLLSEKKDCQRIPEIREKLISYRKRALLSRKVFLKIKAYVLLIWLIPDIFYEIYPMLKK